jgi:hypothetical protein
MRVATSYRQKEGGIVTNTHKLPKSNLQHRVLTNASTAPRQSSHGQLVSVASSARELNCMGNILYATGNSWGNLVELWPPHLVNRQRIPAKSDLIASEHFRSSNNPINPSIWADWIIIACPLNYFQVASGRLALATIELAKDDS